MAPKKKEKNLKRSNIITLKLTDIELAVLNEASDVTGLSRSESLYVMCYSNLLHFDMEQWGEKITDCINYLILLKALVKEEQAYGSH